MLDMASVAPGFVLLVSTGGHNHVIAVSIHDVIADV